MSDYPIFDISDCPEVQTEQMGSKDKFWIEFRDARWLFKVPRPGTGEHWAERIAAELAHLLGMPAAVVEFAVRDGIRGTISRTFLGPEETLVHGNELMAAYVEDYDQAKRFKQREHRLDLILECVKRAAPRGPSEDYEDPLLALVGYFVLDALIGNTDRHHENWAIIRSQHPTKLAPTYDHASSLGRELTDRGREQKLRSRGVGHYLAHGRGGIYVKGQNRQVPPIALLGEFRKLRYGASVDHWSTRLDTCGVAALRTAVARVPDGWMSDVARSFAVAILEHQFDKTRRPQ